MTTTPHTAAGSPPESALAGLGRSGLRRPDLRRPGKHQSIGNDLADMVSKLTAARQLVLLAAERFEAGQRCDMEAGMAKLFASETAMEIALAVRIHGGYSYSTEYDAKRYFRDAPLMLVGEGTNEIQRNVIVSQPISRGGVTADSQRGR